MDEKCTIEDTSLMPEKRGKKLGESFPGRSPQQLTAGLSVQHISVQLFQSNVF